jgi:Ca2+-binding EF-hand superfamily protein
LDLSGEITGAETRISLDNFIKVCDIVVEQVEMRRRAIQKFLLLDTDKSGYLENSELHKGTWVHLIIVGASLNHHIGKCL